MPVLLAHFPNQGMPASQVGSTFRGKPSSYRLYPHHPYAPVGAIDPRGGPVVTHKGALSLGSPARLNFREPGIRGVNAIGSQMTPQTVYTRQGSSLAVQSIPQQAAQHWYGSISNAVGTGQTGAPQVPQATVPRFRLGPIAKLAVGSGQTAKKGGSALGYTPTGYSTTQFVSAGAGMGNMPGRQDSFDGTIQQYNMAYNRGPSGYPLQGIAATSGWEMQATYHPHDVAVGYFFNRHGRQTGSWQETGYGPGYRNLRYTQQPEVYNMGRSLAVHLARPLSQNVYFLAYQTPASSAARIGAMGMNVGTLGYSGG